MLLLITGSRVRVPPGSPDNSVRINSKSVNPSRSHDCLTLTVVEYGHGEADATACEELRQLQEVGCGLPAEYEAEVSAHHRPVRSGSKWAKDSQGTIAWNKR